METKKIKDLDVAAVLDSGDLIAIQSGDSAKSITGEVLLKDCLKTNDISDWAKADEKPKYAPQEVGIENNDVLSEFSENDGKLLYKGEEIGGGGSEHTLPIAAADTLGGIKVGDNLTIDENGVLSVNIIDSLDSTSTNSALSANQGKILFDKYSEVFQYVSNGKRLLASTLTDLGFQTDDDASFENIKDNILILANSKIDPNKMMDSIIINKSGNAISGIPEEL